MKDGFIGVSGHHYRPTASASFQEKRAEQGYGRTVELHNGGCRNPSDRFEDWPHLPIVQNDNSLDYEIATTTVLMTVQHRAR